MLQDQGCARYILCHERPHALRGKMNTHDLTIANNSVVNVPWKVGGRGEGKGKAYHICNCQIMLSLPHSDSEEISPMTLASHQQQHKTTCQLCLYD